MRNIRCESRMQMTFFELYERVCYAKDDEESQGCYVGVLRVFKRRQVN
jgi:hypothetical protein